MEFFQLAKIAENKFKIPGKYHQHRENGSFAGTPKLMRQWLCWCTLLMRWPQHWWCW